MKLRNLTSLIVAGAMALSATGCGKSKEALAVKSIIIDENRCAAITEDGGLYTWKSTDLWDDDETNYALGHKSKEATSPERILDNVESVYFGYKRPFGVALTKEGDVYTWGISERGQLGNGSTSDLRYPTKIMENVRQISVGLEHAGAVTNDDELYMWGANGGEYKSYSTGEVGNGTAEDVLSPVKVMDDVKKVDLGKDHSGAITNDGSLYMWGSNDNGEIGNDSYSDCLSPVKIMSDVKDICLGDDTSFAITNTGDLYEWGSISGNYIAKSPEFSAENIKTIFKYLEYLSFSVSYINENNELFCKSAGYYTKVMDNVAVGTGNYAISEDGTLYRITVDESDVSTEKVMDNVSSASLGPYYYGSECCGIITKDGKLYIGDNYSCKRTDDTSDDTDWINELKEIKLYK